MPLKPAPDWVDPSSKKFNLFEEMVDAYPNIPEDEIPSEGSVIDFTKTLKKVMKIQKLQLSDIVNITKAGFSPFKTSITSKLQCE